MKIIPPPAGWSPEPDALQARFALRVAARLDELAADPGHDIAERLRVSRERALERARAMRASHAAVAGAGANGGATLTLTLRPPGGGSSRWLKLASVLPLVALVAGLVLIEDSNVDRQVRTAADIDAALLADDLPPDAYSDPGFDAFLKAPRE